MDMQRQTFRHGATSMLAGTPGSFKSVLALNMLVTWTRAGKSVLYFSGDSDEFTVARRVSGIITGDDQATIEAAFLKGDAKRYLTAIEETLENVVFVYELLSMDGIADHMKAFESVNGAFPDAVFLDNLMDYTAAGDEWAEMREMTKDLDAMARETMSHIVILHHAGDQAPVGVPPARSFIQGKVTQKARLVLSLAANNGGVMCACVKNTNGPQDPSGATFTGYVVDSSLRILDMARY
jgi:hypothetical protein